MINLLVAIQHTSIEKNEIIEWKTYQKKKKRKENKINKKNYRALLNFYSIYTNVSTYKIG